MRLLWLLLLSAVSVKAIAIQRRDAEFFNVQSHIHKDMSGRRGDPKDKYFHESIFHPHYDGRFADKQLGYQERKHALSNLMQTYLATFADLHVETWLMHGTLLGWWWNRKILPWDSDSDVQVSESSMHYLASYYNMTVFHYKTPRIPEGRDYLLEINPHYINREQSDKLNVIDARWVDTTSGLFIDITTARYNLTHPAGEGMLVCKDGHEYRDTYIFPLRDTVFEGAPAKIPFAYKEVLEAEYHKKALTLTDYEDHHFDDEKLEWIPVAKTVDPASLGKGGKKVNSDTQSSMGQKTAPQGLVQIPPVDHFKGSPRLQHGMSPKPGEKGSVNKNIPKFVQDIGDQQPVHALGAQTIPSLSAKKSSHGIYSQNNLAQVADAEAAPLGKIPLQDLDVQGKLSNHPGQLHSPQPSGILNPAILTRDDHISLQIPMPKKRLRKIRKAKKPHPTRERPSIKPLKMRRLEDRFFTRKERIEQRFRRAEQKRRNSELRASIAAARRIAEEKRHTGKGRIATRVRPSIMALTNPLANPVIVPGAKPGTWRLPEPST